MRTAARTPAPSPIRLAALLLFTGSGGRRGFRAAVPSSLPLDNDTVVVASGMVELAFGAALAASPRCIRPAIGVATAAFFVAVLPCNIVHWVNRRDVPGLDSDGKRFARLFLHPMLAAWAWWSTRRPAGS